MLEPDQKNAGCLGATGETKNKVQHTQSTYQNQQTNQVF
jgi:hypothetical protein